jgi:hypothetical protein
LYSLISLPLARHLAHQEAPILRRSTLHFFNDSHHSHQGEAMLLIREVFYCKPGKVRPMVEKFLAMSKLNEKLGLGKMRVMTDFCGERYWTIISEWETSSMKDFEEMMQGKGPVQDPEAMKEMENIMKDYHDFVDHGRREIYKIEV